MTWLLLSLSGCLFSSDVAEEDVGLDLFHQGLEDGATATHDISEQIEKIVGRSDGLSKPTDLDFNPDKNGELWIVNKDDDSTTIVFDAGTPDQESLHLIDPYALHFMELVTSISFGQSGTFGTCQDGTNTYNGQAPGNLFTGPTLWSSDLDIFAQSNPEAVDFLTDLFGFPTDLGSHLDMMHETPECMGMEWEKKNVYWVFNGYHSAIDRYDFALDHGPGFDDHSDGNVRRYVEGKVKRQNNVVSHLVLDHDTKLLYIANSGKGQVDVLDTTDGNEGDPFGVNWGPSETNDRRLMKGVQLETLASAELMNGEPISDGAPVPPPLDTPSGIDLVEGLLFVTDNANSHIYVFDLAGNLVDWADTGLKEGSLAGIRAMSSQEIWFVDQKGDAVYRLTM